MIFRLTGTDADGRDARSWNVSVKEFYGKVFADKGHIRRVFFEGLSDRGIHPCTHITVRYTTS